MPDPNDASARPDDTFDKFFRPRRPDRGSEPGPRFDGRSDTDITDPGVPSAPYADQRTQQAPAAGAQYYQQPDQGSGYVEQPPAVQQEHGRKASLLLPLMILLASLGVLSFVGYLILVNKDANDASGNQNSAPATISGTTDGTGAATTDGPSSPSTDPGTSSQPSSPTSSPSTPIALPAGTDTRCGDPMFSSSKGVSCAFAKDVATQAQTITPGSSRQIGAYSAAVKLQYTLDCNYPEGSFITCVGKSNPDNGRRPTIYVLPGRS